MRLSLRRRLARSRVIRSARVLTVTATLATVALTGACGDNDSQPTANAPTAASSPTRRAAGHYCESDAAGSTPVWFTDKAGATVAGLILGTGKVGIVLEHIAGADSCEWLPYAHELVTAGYRVLAFDFPGSGSSDAMPSGDTRDAAVVAAADVLRQQGVTSIALMGGSMGGNAALVAATEITPPVVCVISLSAPTEYQGLSAIDAVSKLAVPVLYMAGDEDGGFPRDAKALYDATPASVTRVLTIVPSMAHGPALLIKGTIEHDAARTAVTTFLAAHAPVS